MGPRGFAGVLVMEQSRRNRPVTIAIPSSLISDVPHLREKTTLVGQIGRAAAVFRVEHIVVYKDPLESRNEEVLIKKLLEYMDTPQYLRKALFPLDTSLAYAGLLHPLRTPHHPIASRVRDLQIGDMRKGVVVETHGGKALVEIGVERTIALKSAEPTRDRKRSVRITQIKPRLEGETVEDREVPFYWGFEVVTARSLSEVVKNFRPGLTVATSRWGDSLMNSLTQLRNEWAHKNSLLLAFGSSKNGLAEILRSEGMELGEVFDFTLNFVPDQGSQTVRTEEALLCVLGIVNVLLDDVAD